MINNGNVYLVGYERGGNSKIYLLPENTWDIDSHVPTVLTSSVRIGLNTSTEKNPVAGDISPDGKEILIKTKHQVYHWTFTSGNLFNVFDVAPVMLNYTFIDQDESVCWSYDGSGYFTIPEGTNPPLYFYRRA